MSDTHPNLTKTDPDTAPDTEATEAAAPTDPDAGSAAMAYYAAETARTADSRTAADRTMALVNLQMSDPGLASLVADGRPFVRCGTGCGFVAVSDSAGENRRALEEHPCPNGEGEAPPSPQIRYVDRTPKPWHASLFSLPGLAIVTVLGLVILIALGWIQPT